MRIGFNRHFYRYWAFWVGLAFLVGDLILRYLGQLTSDPVGLTIGGLWLGLGLFLRPFRLNRDEDEQHGLSGKRADS